MKYQISHVFRTSTTFKKKSSDNFKDLHQLKLLTTFHVNLTSFLRGVVNYVLNAHFITPPGNEVSLTLKFVKSFSL